MSEPFHAPNPRPRRPMSRARGIGMSRSEGSAHLYVRHARTRRVGELKRSSRKTASYWSVVSSSEDGRRFHGRKRTEVPRWGRLIVEPNSDRSTEADRPSGTVAAG